jgi:4-hydroxy-3-methylbut-2-enyl diphosphate reductase
MAIDALDLALERLGPPVYVYHEIVHNRHVVADFCDRGAVFVNSIDEVPSGAVLMYSAHGVSPQVKSRARERSLRTIDATCPLVMKVHLEAIRHAKAGRELILVGHAGHDEVVGTLGEVPEAFHLVESIDDVHRLEFPEGTQLAWLTQTTLSVSDTQDIVGRLQERFPQIVGPRTDDICYATQNRQFAVRKLSEEVDAMVVVGSRNSSNSQRLRETAEQAGITSFLVDDAGELRTRDFAGCGTIGVTAGASAPESSVQDVVNWFITQFFATVETRDFMDERQVFPLPKELAAFSGPTQRFTISKSSS